jgi:hypothetical protein
MTRCEKFTTGKMIMKREVGKDMEAASLGSAEKYYPGNNTKMRKFANELARWPAT